MTAIIWAPSPFRWVSQPFRSMARLRIRLAAPRTRRCTTAGLGAAPGWLPHKRRSAARADPCSLRLSRISVIIAAPHAPVARLGEGGRCSGHTSERRAPAPPSTRPRVRWGYHECSMDIRAAERLDCAEPGSIWKSKRTPNRENEDWLQSRGLADDQLERDHDRKSARCPNRPPAAGRRVRRHDSRQRAARRQPPAAGPEREPEGGGSQHDQYDRRGRAGFEFHDGGREG